MKRQYKWLPRLPMLLGFLACGLLLSAIYLLRETLQKPVQPKKQAQQITMIQPPPPPPPEIKPPEPEIKEEKIEEPIPDKEPEPAPEQADEPPAEELGLDTEGEAGGDAFGLAARKGGRTLLGGAPGNAIVWYGGQIEKQVEKALQEQLADTVAGKSAYSVLLDIWVDGAGRITRSELVDVSGNAEVDRALRAALGGLNIGIGRSPPQNMPQPVRIRLTSQI